MSARPPTDRTHPTPAGAYHFHLADLWWLLGAPLYLLIGTARHEAAHALWAWVEGTKVTRFVFWPTVQPDGLYWGYVRWEGTVSWAATAAPYFLDLLTFALAFLLATRLPWCRRWLWLQVVIVGMVSPLVNSAAQYAGGARYGGGDVGQLLALLPAATIHLYFTLTLSLYATGLLWVLWPRRPGRR